MDFNLVDCASPSKKLKPMRGALVSDPGNPSSMEGTVDSEDLIQTCPSDLMESNDIECSNSDSSLVDDDDNGGDGGGGDDGNEDDNGGDDDYLDDNDDDDDDVDDDYFGYDDISCKDEYALLQAQFDNVDLPSGMEVSLASLNVPSLSESIQATETLSDLSKTDESKEVATSSSIVHHAESSSSSTKIEGNGSDGKFENFDVVDDISDHHYADSGFSGVKPPKNWAKRIQEEWKSLKTNLPETIFVRVSETRMELLKAVILGPSGTPYHDGLFAFDCLFPSNYPDSPPLVYYYASGLRLNPNLYDCGKVCLSLLGTWSGKNNENWVPGESTMLQVLVSIQAFILNEKPYFNEPGYESSSGTKEGERQSKAYNENVFILSLKTMLYTIRSPPKHFEDLVVHHFRRRAHDILVACEAYLEGVEVGSEIDKDEVQKEAKNSAPSKFKSDVAGMMKLLVRSFVENGSPECERFRNVAQNYISKA